MTISKRHHFIPKFFIKGFTGSDGKLAVFNKTKNQLESSRKSPKQIFYEWNRNTFEVNGEETDYVENLYKFSEDQFAPLHKKIISKDYKIQTEEFFPIIHFLGICHYRVPSQDERAENKIKNSTNDELFFKILKKGSNEEASKDLYERIRNDSSFIESSKMMLAVSDFIKADLPSNFSDWKIYEAATNVRLHIVGDNPVILNTEKDPNLYKNELVFPLSNGKTLYHVNGKSIKEITPEHRVCADILMFIQSERYVCGPDNKYLGTIAHMSNLYNNPNGIKYLKEKVFEIFREN